MKKYIKNVEFPIGRARSQLASIKMYRRYRRDMRICGEDINSVYSIFSIYKSPS